MDLAHLGPVELLTPKGEESLHFFVDIMGMEIEAQEGQSYYLRGWGDYQRWSTKLTESDTSGMACLGLRAWDDDALQRTVRREAVLFVHLGDEAAQIHAVARPMRAVRRGPHRHLAVARGAAARRDCPHLRISRRFRQLLHRRLRACGCEKQRDSSNSQRDPFHFLIL